MNTNRESALEAMVEIKTTFVQGHFDILTSDIERLSGRSPKSLQDILTTAFQPRVR